MRGSPLDLPAIARAIGFTLVAVVIIAATLHFREAPSRTPDGRATPAARSDPLADELKRCQIIAAQAKDDARCEAAWAEGRRRFFTYSSPSNAAATPAASPKLSDR